MHKFTIDRKTWLRGEGSLCSFLLRAEDGKQCCLGFYLKSCGVPSDEILGFRSPICISGISDNFLSMPKTSWLFSSLGVLSNSTNDLMTLNDSTNVASESMKENLIKKIFLKNDVEAEFVN